MLRALSGSVSFLCEPSLIRNSNYNSKLKCKWRDNTGVQLMCGCVWASSSVRQFCWESLLLEWRPSMSEILRQQRKRRQHLNTALYLIRQLETFFSNAVNSSENDVASRFGLVLSALAAVLCRWVNEWMDKGAFYERITLASIHTCKPLCRCGQRTWIIYFSVCSSILAQLYPLCEHSSSVGHENSRDKCGAIRHQETVQVCKLDLEKIGCSIRVGQSERL